MFKNQQIIIRKKYSSIDKKRKYPQRCKILAQDDRSYLLLTILPLTNTHRTEWIDKRTIHNSWKLARVKNTALARKLHKIKINKDKEWIEL